MYLRLNQIFESPDGPQRLQATLDRILGYLHHFLQLPFGELLYVFFTLVPNGLLHLVNKLLRRHVQIQLLYQGVANAVKPPLGIPIILLSSV